MKTCSSLLFWIWCFQSVSSTHSFLDRFFGRGPCRDAANDEAKVECEINEVLKKMGMEPQSQTVQASVVEEGKRGLYCLASISGIDLDKKLALLGPFGFLRNLAFRLYGENSDPERIDSLCQSAQRRASLGRKLMSEHTEAEQKLDKSKNMNQRESHHGHEDAISKTLGSHLRRRLGTPAAVDKPGSHPEYDAWATANLGDYLGASGSSGRADLDLVSVLVLNPLVETRQGIIQSGLRITEGIYRIICNVAGSVELGFDPGDACRVIEAVIGLAAQIEELATSGQAWELQEIVTHNLLVDGAETEAVRADVATLVTDLTR